MKRRTFVRSVGLSAAGLAFYHGASGVWKSPEPKNVKRGMNGDLQESLEADTLRLGYREGKRPLLVLSAKSGSEWRRVCALDHRGLQCVRLFATQFPFGSGEPDWKAKKNSDRGLSLRAEFGGREVSHDFEIADDPPRIKVESSLTTLGDELLEWFQDDWAFLADRALDFAFVPNLRPEDDMVIGDHVFRAPAIVLMKDGMWSTLIPDLDSLASVKHPNWISADFDIEAEDYPSFKFGFKAYQPISHTYYRHSESMLFTPPSGTMGYRYEILAGTNAGRSSITRKATSYHWQKFAGKYVGSVLPQTIPFSNYAGYSYRTLFESGEFKVLEIAGEKAGGFKALYDGGYFRRPENVLLNQAWYNNMRSAYGLYHYGRKLDRKLWRQNADRIKSWTLSAPQTHGLFPAMYDYVKKEWWGSLPRLNGGRERIECVNAAWTSIWLLWWNRDFGQDNVSSKYVRPLADFFVSNQLRSGAIPAWFDLSPDKSNPPVAVETLKESAETAGSAMLLAELALMTGDRSYAEALTRAADFLVREVIPQMKYWDFETFWSCSWKSLDMVDRHTGILPQNTFSAYWTAHALARAFEINGERKYLDAALEALDVLNFYQQVWNPPWLNLYAFGGFGVMNTDGEWNDARQAVFAPVYMDAYKLTGEREYFERGVAALRAAFTLMAIPENKEVSPRTWNALPTGLCPENYAHTGVDGVFARSDSDWGEAGALSAAALVENTYGGVYVDTRRGNGFGIDGCEVVSLKKSDAGVRVEVRELLGYSRDITVRTDTGKHKSLFLHSRQSTEIFLES